MEVETTASDRYARVFVSFAIAAILTEFCASVLWFGTSSLAFPVVSLLVSAFVTYVSAAPVYAIMPLRLRDRWCVCAALGCATGVLWYVALALIFGSGYRLRDHYQLASWAGLGLFEGLAFSSVLRLLTRASRSQGIGRYRMRIATWIILLTSLLSLASPLFVLLLLFGGRA